MSHPRDPDAYPMAFNDMTRAVGLEGLEVPYPEPNNGKAIALRSRWYSYRSALRRSARAGNEAHAELVVFANSLMITHDPGVGLIFKPLDSAAEAQGLRAAIGASRGEP